MKDKLRDLFTFSSGERKGIIALVFVLIVICGLNMILRLCPPAPVQTKYPDWMKDSGTLEAIEKNYYPEQDDASLDNPMPAGAPAGEQKPVIDPNTASLEDLLLSGFSLRIARTIINYREKGGKFRTAGDLKKIYGLTPAIFQSVEPYIRIKEEYSKPVFIAELPVTIDINSADSVLFEKLPGVGGILARRIVRYRRVLGGYYSPEQIREVYGISDSLFLRIGKRLVADTAGIKKININTVEEKDLASHPYVGRYLAAGIVKYRLHVGKILNFNELLINGLIPKDRCDRLKYYISL